MRLHGSPISRRAGGRYFCLLSQLLQTSLYAKTFSKVPVSRSHMAYMLASSAVSRNQERQAQMVVARLRDYTLEELSLDLGCSAAFFITCLAAVLHATIKPKKYALFSQGSWNGLVILQDPHRREVLEKALPQAGLYKPPCTQRSPGPMRRAPDVQRISSRTATSKLWASAPACPHPEALM